MKTLRMIIVVALVAYVAWIAIPGVQTFANQYMAPAEAGPPPPPEAAASELAPVAEAAPSAEATATAVAEGSAPKIGLWAAAIGLYLIAAILFAGNNARAFIAYLFAFGADVVLMLLSRPDAAISARSAIVEAVPDLRLAATVALGLVGLIILATAGRGGGRRTA